METKIKTLGILHAKSFSAELDQVGRGSGETTQRIVIRHPSAVVVIPVLEDGRTLLVRQHRYALGRETLEFPAGKLDPGEDPEKTAFRELAEETGRRAGRLTRLLSFAPSIGYSTEIIHIFLAHELTVLDQVPDEDEISAVVEMPLAELKEMILAGKIIDGTTMLALAVYEWSDRS